MQELMRTPLTLDKLDGEHAWFAGTASETHKITSLFGEMEIEGKYPMMLLQRDIWQSLGSPINVTLVVEEGAS